MSNPSNRPKTWRSAAMLAGIAAAVAAGIWLASKMASSTADPPPQTVAEPATSEPVSRPPSTPSSTLPTPTTTTTTTPPLLRAPGTVPAWTVGEPWGKVEGLTMFRGNPTRSWYGRGPVPSSPQILWRYPEEAMCRSSLVAGEPQVWCGTGWTGQPVVWEQPDGVTELIFGALDGQVHFVDADTGLATRAPFRTGDLIKGSVTLDPDGFPLLYLGSRDNRLRALALDREPVAELWSLDASAVRGIWNNDWDANPVVVDDILYEGGENGWFFAIRLNRRYTSEGMISVDPEVLFQMPGYTDDLIRLVGRNVSIESSTALFEDRAFFTNGGGRVVGLDVSEVQAGQAPVVFDFWMGDDVDATAVIDDEGMLYVAAELERGTRRSAEVGQLVKLDPRAGGDSPRWSIPIPAEGTDAGGVWATPALGDGYLYVSTNPGALLSVSVDRGEVAWRDEVGWHAWSSPVLIDDHLLVATCTGEIRAYGLDDPARPRPVWTFQIPSATCVESTPAVWDGRIYVGGRDGYLYAIGDFLDEKEAPDAETR